VCSIIRRDNGQGFDDFLKGLAPGAGSRRLPHRRIRALSKIVLRNGDYGALKSFARQLKSKEPPPGVELPGLDFEALAAGLGLQSVGAGQADTLAETLKRAFDEEGPMLVEIAVDPDSGSIY
jgi:benzoylformate decarboxylase